MRTRPSRPRSASYRLPRTISLVSLVPLVAMVRHSTAASRREVVGAPGDHPRVGARGFERSVPPASPLPDLPGGSQACALLHAPRVGELAPFEHTDQLV